MNTAPQEGSPWRGGWIRAAMLLKFVAFWSAFYLLHREWTGFHVADLSMAFHTMSGSRVAMAAGCGLLSYVFASLAGLVGYRWLGRPPRGAGRDFMSQFVVNAFSRNAGSSVSGAGSIRQRFANAQNEPASRASQAALFTDLTNWAGLLTLCGLLLCVETPPLPWMPGAFAKGLGAILAVAGGLLPFGALVWPSFWPPPGVAIRALVLSILNWAATCAALWALLPENVSLSLGSIIAVAALAHAAAALTQVPGGLGVLECLLTLALTGIVASPALGAALVAYRLVAYLLPFGLAISILGAPELTRHHLEVVRGGRAALRGWSLIAPRLAAMLTLAGGFLLLISANTPMDPSRRGIVALIPLPFVEASHFVSSIVGAMLMVLASGLQRRVQTAWWLSVCAVSGGIVFSLVKGFDWEEALVLTFILFCLLSSRPYFHRHAALWTHRFTGGWWLLLSAMMGVSLWVGFFATRHIPYQNDLWWKFALEADASRFLRAAVAAACVFLVTGFAQVLRPAKPRHKRLQPEPEEINRLVGTSDHADAALAWLGDKEFLISADGRCGLMYADQGRSRIVMGDPLGDAEAADDLLWQLQEQAQDEGMCPVFFQVSPREMPRLVDMGLRLFKLGEEARVPLPKFSLEGSAAKKLRHSRSRFVREGRTFEIWPAEEVAAKLPVLQAISDRWLEEHRAGEMSFSMGRFDPQFVRRFPCAVVKDPGGCVVAFATLWQTPLAKEEFSVDLMRHLPEAPHGVMESMFIELILWGQEQGYAYFNLGMAALSGLSTHPIAPLWHKFAGGIYRRGEPLYKFQGLRNFKEKFNPVWEPRYLAIPGSWRLPSVLLDVTTLIGGGLPKTLGLSKS